MILEYQKTSDYPYIKRKADEFYKELHEKRKLEKKLTEVIAEMKERLQANWNDDEALMRKTGCQTELNAIRMSYEDFYNKWHKTKLYRVYSGVYCTILEDVERTI